MMDFTQNHDILLTKPVTDATHVTIDTVVKSLQLSNEQVQFYTQDRENPEKQNTTPWLVLPEGKNRNNF